MINLLLLPPLLLLLVVFCIPLLRYIWLSFHSSSVITGLEAIPNNGANWERLINDQHFWQVFFQTLRFSIVSVGIEILLAIAIALLLDQRWRGRGIVRAITLLPWALPTTVMALGWRWIFNASFGPVKNLFTFMGISNMNILASPKVAWLSTVLADVWKTTPFVAIIILAGLQTIPNDYYEAIKLEGGNQKISLFLITIPLLKPYIFISLLFRFSQAFGVFDLIQVMTGGGPGGSTESLALYAYFNAMRFLDFSYSSTVMISSFVLLIFLFIIGTVTISNSSKLMRRIMR